MGRIYVTDKLLPAVKLMTKAYGEHRVTADEAYAMAYYMAYHKEENETEEKKNPQTPIRKEEKEKEESYTTTTTTKKSKKSSFFSQLSFPTLDEVELYHKTLGIKKFTAERFYKYYSIYGWKSKGGGQVSDWKEKMREWNANEELKYYSNDDKRGKKPDTHAQGGSRKEADRRVFEEWLDVHYPATAEATERVHAAVERGETKLEELARAAGKEIVYRVVMGELFKLGVALNSSRRILQPEYMEQLAQMLLMEARGLQMDELRCFFRRCREGKYGTFAKGLLMTDLMKAWRKEEMKK